MTLQDIPAGAPAKGAWKRIPAGYKLAIVAPGLVALAMGGNFVYLRSKVSAELQAVRQAGFPTTLRELNDYYPVPSGKNAAEIYASAFAAFPDGGGDLPIVGEGRLPPRGEPLPADMKAALSAFLAANGQSLELLHRAASIESCRFPVDFSRLEEMPLPHLQTLHRAARLLKLEALMKAEEGKPEEAASAILAAFAAGRSVRNEPLLVSQLVRLKTHSASLSALELVLSRTALGDRQLAELSNALASEDSWEGFRRGMAGERCMGEDLFQQWGVQYARAGSSGAAAHYLHRAGSSALRDHAEYLRAMGMILGAADETAKKTCDPMRGVVKQISQAPGLSDLMGSHLPVLARFSEEQLRSLARLRTARAALAVERFRLANGRLPDSLAELAPKFLEAVPADPFDAQPIRYKKLSKGFATHSVGPDLRAEGGVDPTPLGYSRGAAWDITFIVER